MPIVYVVPGLAASKLYVTAGVFPEAWPAFTLLAFGKIQHLALDANGIDPKPDGGEELQPLQPGRYNANYPINEDGFLINLYSGLEDGLYRQLGEFNYEVQPWPYDWRKNIRTNGFSLATRIRTDFPTNGPCSIVAHSEGGLVARMAWYALTKTSQQHMVRRIVTLGTPHQGSYTAVQVALGISPIIDGILNINSVTAGLPALRGGFLRHQLTAAEVSELALTWPSIYMLMPLLGGTENTTDPNRRLLYQKTNWPREAHVDQSWLTFVRTTWGPLLLHPDTIPPFSVLTTVDGTGFGTADRLYDPSRPILPSKIGSNFHSDNTVTSGSAIIPRSRQYHFTARHIFLPNLVGVSRYLREMILDERSDVDPTPAPTVDRVVYLEDPPAPPLQNLGNFVTLNPCANGACPC